MAFTSELVQPSYSMRMLRDVEEWRICHLAGGHRLMQEHMNTGSEAVGEPGIVTVHGTTADLVQDIVVGPHHLRADEPVAFGGTDSGPSPSWSRPINISRRNVTWVDYNGSHLDELR